jgi:hypothetical protein
MATGLFVFSFGVYLVRYLNAIRRSPPPPDRSASDGRSSNPAADTSDAADTASSEADARVAGTGPSLERSLSIRSLL